MQQRWSVAAAIVLAACSPVCLAQAVLTGNVQAGLYQYYNQDVEIYNLRIIPGPNGERTLTVKVHNGHLTVTSGPNGYWGIDGSGEDGVNGTHGVPGTPPTAGTNAGEPFNVVLETLPTMTGNVLGSITIGAPVDVAGGDGGDGGNGADASIHVCGFSSAQAGAAAGLATDGGNITIRSAGDISISASLVAVGGAGGDGGSGGMGILGPAQASQPGTDGGDGGTVIIEQTSASPTATCVLLAGTGPLVDPNGIIYAYGGNGGNGGHGNFGSGFSSAGSDGGDGGNGGDIQFDVRNLTFAITGYYHAPGGAAYVYGGAGGFGGYGGDGSNSGIYFDPCDDCYATAASTGAMGGNGGDGGDGGSITGTVDGDLTLSYRSHLAAYGGNGAPALGSGNGSVDRQENCFSIAPCSAWTALAAGATPTSGAGGDGGLIDLDVGDTISLGWTADYRATMSVLGGDGADGAHAALPGYYCCGKPLTQHSVPGPSGGNGAAGGLGGTIDLSYTTLAASTTDFYVCGGLGGKGGDGSYGSPPGTPGNGLSNSATGNLVLNSVPQLVFSCFTQTPVNGSPKSFPDCVIINP